jgi:hypothetical protein
LRIQAPVKNLAILQDPSKTFQILKGHLRSCKSLEDPSRSLKKILQHPAWLFLNNLHAGTQFKTNPDHQHFALTIYLQVEYSQIEFNLPNNLGLVRTKIKIQIKFMSTKTPGARFLGTSLSRSSPVSHTLENHIFLEESHSFL